MINQERVRWMSQMAMLESGVGEKELKICSYRKVDYILLQILCGFIMGTVCFVAILLLWFFLQWDGLNLYFADANYIGFIHRVLQKYAIFIVIYMAIAGIVAGVRYRSCRRRRVKYLKFLRRLTQSYDQEDEEEF